MKKGRCLVFGLLGLVLVVGLSGCIISASPDPGTIIEMKPGDKVLFKVVGPVNTLTTNSVWTITRKNLNFENYDEVVSEGKNEFELVYNSDSKLSNKKNIITCESQSFAFKFHCNGGFCYLGWGWETTDSRKWEVMVNQNSDTVITGDYIIENDSDLQLLKGYTTVMCSLIIGPNVESLEGLENLTTIGGGLGISGNKYITNLAGLENLTSIGGSLSIGANAALTSLSGLESLTSVGGDLYIYSNPALTSLSGLENLTSVGRDLSISGNNALTNMSGLESLTSVGGGLYIRGNEALTTLSGLDNLTSVGGDLYIRWNPALTSLSGLENIASVGGSLDIEHNDALTNLSGLENIASVGGDLYIYSNATLTNLSGLENLTSIGGDLEIGDYYDGGNPALTALGMAGLQRIDGGFYISGNVRLCTSLAEELMNQVLAGGGIGDGTYIEDNKECTTP